MRVSCCRPLAVRSYPCLDSALFGQESSACIARAKNISVKFNLCLHNSMGSRPSFLSFDNANIIIHM